jgi:hypothetical protein
MAINNKFKTCYNVSIIKAVLLDFDTILWKKQQYV